jgi:mRNA-degrading endonuclease toxin of MazEF toxin-antitoxin module
MANQIRTVSKQRVLKKLGALDGGIMARIEDAVLIHLDIER